MKIITWARSIIARLSDIQDKLQKIQLSLGRIESRQVLSDWEGNVQQAQFQIFSQWGEDGLIQMLINNIDIKQKVFVEFGVQNYTESNTRFLLMNENWAGLVIDGSEDHINYIKSDDIYWKYNLKADCSFITRDNINEIFSRNGISGNIGLLSIDIDGNDYWVWKNIDSVNPAIVIVEYNARFGDKKAVTVPYKHDFVREEIHCSNIYYGASLKAFSLLANAKGYAFVGSNTAGNNAFFVRRDLKPECIKELSVTEGFVKNKFREARDENGNLAFYDEEQERQILENLPLEDVSDDFLKKEVS